MPTVGPDKSHCPTCEVQRRPDVPRPARKSQPVLIGRKVNGRKVGLRPFVGVGA